MQLTRPVVAALASALAAGCAGADLPDTRPGRPCTTAAQCTSGEVCHAGRCAAGSPADAGPTPGRLTLTPASATVTAEAGRTGASGFKLRNDGGELLHFEVSCTGATAAPSRGALDAGEATDVALALPSYPAPGAHTATCTATSDADSAALAFTANVVVTADATPPAVALTSPAAAATLSGTVTLAANASDDVGVTSVDLLVDAQVVATVAGLPWSASWDSTAVANGAHQLAARARDAAGNSTTSAPVAVTVSNVGHLTRTPASAQVTVNTGSSPPSPKFALGNDGTAPLHFAVGCDGGATAAPSSGGLAAAASVPVTISLPTWPTVGPRTVTCTSSTQDGAGGPLAFSIAIDVIDDTTPPTVALTAPPATLTGSVTLTATASDDSGVASVEFLVDGSAVATASGVPYAATWNSASVANGAHAISARATDLVGNIATTPSVTVTVANGLLTLAPATASVSTSAGQPTPGATFLLGNDGPAGLHYAVGCDGGATASPASGSLSTNVSTTVSVTLSTYTSAGARTVVCTATTADGGGGPRTFTITVSVGPDVTAPAVSVTSPGAGATVHGTSALTAAASDGVGVTSVHFLVDGADVGSAASAPWSVSWSSTAVADGSHGVVAKAYDAAGNVGTSAPVTFTVNNSSPTGASISVHTTMGIPDGVTAADPNNTTHYLSVKHQYVVSYNATLKVPNWVSWELNSSWLGSQPRSDTFRIDDTLPSPLYAMQGQLTDYSGSGYDRGHMCPSADRTLNLADNTNTFYLTNMVPQAANNNQGPWADLEDYSRTLAKGGKELFVISGPIFDNPAAIARTHGSSTGVAIPSSTYKVVVVLDAAGQGTASVTTATRVIAVVMPNDNSLIGIKDVWTRWCSTPRAIEQATGLDFLSDVPQAVQDVIETRKDNSCP